MRLAPTQQPTDANTFDLVTETLADPTLPNPYYIQCPDNARIELVSFYFEATIAGAGVNQPYLGWREPPNSYIVAAGSIDLPALTPYRIVFSTTCRQELHDPANDILHIPLPPALIIHAGQFFHIQITFPNPLDSYTNAVTTYKRWILG